MSRAHVTGLCLRLMSLAHIIGSCYRLISRALPEIYSHSAMYSHCPPFLPCLLEGLYHPAPNCVYHEISVTGSCPCFALKFLSQVQSWVLVPVLRSSFSHRFSHGFLSRVLVTGACHGFLSPVLAAAAFSYFKSTFTLALP